MKKKTTAPDGGGVSLKNTGQKEFAMSLPLKVSGLDSCGHEFSEESTAGFDQQRRSRLFS